MERANAENAVFSPSTNSVSPKKEENRWIVLVEDHPEETEALVSELSHFGYSVLAIKEFKALHDAVKTRSPLAVILDLDMTFIGDSEEQTDVASEISFFSKRDIPVFVISERNDLTPRLESVRGGAKGYFTKPIEPNKIVDKLDELRTDPILEPYRILIVEENVEAVAKFASSLHQAGMITLGLTNPMKVLETLAQFNPDLILMNVQLPNCNGMELAAVIRQQAAYMATPILFLSDKTDPESQLQAIRMGGDDLLPKPADMKWLAPAVMSRVERLRFLRSFIVRDPLTGLYLYDAVLEHLDVEVARAKRRQAPLVFARVGIDDFKSLNDLYGHHIGDEVLKSFARFLQQRLRKTDLVGRYGGSEFAAILSDAELAQGEKVFDEIRTHFMRVRHPAKNVKFAATCSAGIASFPSYITVNALADAADQALLEARQKGGNCIITAHLI